MKIDSTIPIMVGVTGHRSIRKEDHNALYQSVKAELERLKSSYPDSQFVMLTSLAEGGDLLCAEAAYELQIPVLVALPMPLKEYEKDFSSPAKERLAFHCGRAEDVFVVPPTEPVSDRGIDRDYLFRQAGIYVASHCHILLALWDGGPGTEAACGTAEAVSFALHGSYDPKSSVPARSGDNTGVLHFFTPRGHRLEETAGTVHVLGNRERMEEILRRTNDFNRQAREITESGRTAEALGGARAVFHGAEETQAGPQPEDASKGSPPEDASAAPQVEDLILSKMEHVRKAADKLSLKYARRFRQVLALLAAASMVLTFAFLMYDEAQAIWMILVCGIMLLGAWACQRYASRSHCHSRYIEYRALSECLRVQYFLRYAGSDLEASGLLTWTQQEETAWILDAMCVLTAGTAAKERHDIRDCWVEDQRSYHEWAGKRSLHNIRVSENVVHTALIVSIVLYLAAVFFELLCGGLFLKPAFYVAGVERYRTGLKIVLGTISAVTLFISNYYGRLSLSRTFSDHQKMERFYAKMAGQIAQKGQTRELLTVLAREELIENGNWMSYQRDNKPDMSL